MVSSARTIVVRPESSARSERKRLVLHQQRLSCELEQELRHFVHATIAIEGRVVNEGPLQVRPSLVIAKPVGDTAKHLRKRILGGSVCEENIGSA